jgi:hypothetical protein
MMKHFSLKVRVYKVFLLLTLFASRNTNSMDDGLLRCNMQAVSIESDELVQTEPILRAIHENLRGSRGWDIESWRRPEISDEIQLPQCIKEITRRLPGNFVYQNEKELFVQNKKFLEEVIRNLPTSLTSIVMDYQPVNDSRVSVNDSRVSVSNNLIKSFCIQNQYKLRGTADGLVILRGAISKGRIAAVKEILKDHCFDNPNFLTEPSYISYNPLTEKMTSCSAKEIKALNIQWPHHRMDDAMDKKRVMMNYTTQSLGDLYWYYCGPRDSGFVTAKNLLLGKNYYRENNPLALIQHEDHWHAFGDCPHTQNHYPYKQLRAFDHLGIGDALPNLHNTKDFIIFQTKDSSYIIDVNRLVLKEKTGLWSMIKKGLNKTFHGINCGGVEFYIWEPAIGKRKEIVEKTLAFKNYGAQALKDIIQQRDGVDPTKRATIK